ncbi:MAG: FO synthase subunit 1 [Promethearchaeota archaeon]|nr:MAG: FO synthase subunit 1 [Candidatus Lokiarchaeota archaeon]
MKKLGIKELKKKVEKIRSETPENKRNVITFSRNFTLSLSNYCRNECSYCYYNQRIPKKGEQKTRILIKDDKVKELISKGVNYNCKESLIMSGEKPDTFPIVLERLKERGFQSFIEFVHYICKQVMKHNILPHINIGTLSFKELKELKPVNASMGLMLESSCNKLYKKGGVHEKSPGKDPKKRFEHIENAGKLKIPFTTGLLLGIGESQEDRIKDLLLVKGFHEKYEHIQEVILQNFEEKPTIPYNPRKEEKYNMKDMLRLVGIAKVLFKNEIAIQVPPNLTAGYEKNFLELGVDDFGGISPITKDYINPNKKWPQEKYLEKICKRTGFKLKERLAIYPKYITKRGFCPDQIKTIIKKIDLDVGN